MAVKAHALPTALMLSSLASAAVVALVAALANFPYAPMTFVVWLVLGSAANLLVAGSLGLAWHVFAYARNWRGVIAYVAPGMLVGVAIPFALFVLPPILDGSGLDSGIAGFLFVISTIIGVALGGFTALFAWLIRRPDRDHPSAASNTTSE